MKQLNIFLFLFFYVSSLWMSAQNISETATLSANEGNDRIRAYQTRVDDFKKLNINASLNVIYKCNPDSAGLAIFETADAETASNIFFTPNSKGSLTIETDYDFVPVPDLPVITVYSSGLEKIVNSGDSTAFVYGLPKTEKLDIVLMGNGKLNVYDIDATELDASIRSGHGDLTITGECEKAKIGLVGTGRINGQHLKINDCKAAIVGPGTFICDVTEKLTISGMGHGHIYYIAKPAMLKNRSAGVRASLLEF